WCVEGSDQIRVLGGKYIVLFRCDWYDVLNSRRGINVDKFGYVSVDIQRFLKMDDPFVLASQVSQVFYATDVIKKGSWCVVVKTKPRATYDVSTTTGDSQSLETLVDVEDAYQQHESFDLHVDGDSEYTHNDKNYEVRIDMEPEIIDLSTLVRKRKRNV
ncbi:Homeobox protein Hox-A10, partial [Bienertia sinuspersici]